MSGKRREKTHEQIVVYWFVVFFICILDQLAKFYAGKLIPVPSGIPVIKNVFHLTLAHNTGAAFSLFANHPALFIGIAFFAIIIITYFLTIKRDILSSVEAFALCFILGGTIGNLIDRLRFGYVVDFLDFRVWPVFNVADSFITIGAVLLASAMIWGRKCTA